MLAADDAPQAVADCTPPQARHQVARRRLEQEKPPTATLGELEDLRELAESSGATLSARGPRFAPAVGARA